MVEHCAGSEMEPSREFRRERDPRVEQQRREFSPGGLQALLSDTWKGFSKLRVLWKNSGARLGGRGVVAMLCGAFQGTVEYAGSGS